MKKGNLGRKMSLMKELSCTSISSQSLQMLPILEGQFLSSAVQARHVRRRFGISAEYMARAHGLICETNYQLKEDDPARKVKRARSATR